MTNNKKEFEENFIKTINDKNVETIEYLPFDYCPYCGKLLDTNRNSENTKYKKVTKEIAKRDCIYLKCLNCRLSFTEYSPKHVPYIKTNLAVLLQIIFAPSLSLYELNEITDIRRETIKSIRYKYSKLSRLLCAFLETYNIDNFDDFKTCYENKNMLKAFEESMDVIMPTRFNAHEWIYTYIFDKRKQ